MFTTREVQRIKRFMGAILFSVEFHTSFRHLKSYDQHVYDDDDRGM